MWCTSSTENGFLLQASSFFSFSLLSSPVLSCPLLFLPLLSPSPSMREEEKRPERTASMPLESNLTLTDCKTELYRTELRAPDPHCGHQSTTLPHLQYCAN